MEDVKPSRPKLKINLGGKVDKHTSISTTTPSTAHPDSSSVPVAQSITNSQPVQTPSTITPSQTPATPSGTKHKIKLTMTKSVPATPADGAPPALPPAAPAITAAAPTAKAEAPPPSVTKTKAGRTSKPTAKKRAKEDGDDEDAGAPSSARPAKKVRLTNAVTAGSAGRRNSQKVVSLKFKQLPGEKPLREPGTGYDSEMEGAEDDPIIEEQIVFRMMDDENLDYLRKQVEERRIGAGADLKIRFLDDRRAFVVVQGQPYAAVLVDLPTITEGMKTWDRKALVKSADLCQMLLVFAKVKSEQEAKTIELPKMIMDGHKWPHGLTPPMHDCVHRRFRKRLSQKEISNKEAEVARLLQADQEAEATRYEWVDDRRGTTAWASEGEDHDDQDAEGEEDDGGYFPATGYQQDGEDMDDADLEADLEAELVAALEEDDMEMNGEETPAQVGATPLTTNTITPAPNGETQDNADGDLFDDDDDDDDEDEDEEDLTPEEIDRRQRAVGVKEECRDINESIRNQYDDLKVHTNPILQGRIMLKIKGLRNERRIKLAGVGLPDMHDEFQDPDEEE